jgi:glycosyltransferase involved in cell wall biosynthesis
MKLSVLLPLHAGDAPEALRECLESIGCQTSLPEEVTVVEDGPLRSAHTRVLDRWGEASSVPVRRIRLRRNLGIAAALNVGVRECRYDWVARMDADDIMLPDRLARQRQHLSSGDSDVVGTWIREFNPATGSRGGIRAVPTSHEGVVRWARWARTPMNHMTVIYPKAAVTDVGGYPEDLRKYQDMVLWARLISAGYRLNNIPEVLVEARAGPDFIDRRRGIDYWRCEVQMLRYLRGSGHMGSGRVLLSAAARAAVRAAPRAVLRRMYRVVRR